MYVKQEGAAMKLLEIVKQWTLPVLVVIGCIIALAVVAAFIFIN